MKIERLSVISFLLTIQKLARRPQYMDEQYICIYVNENNYIYMIISKVYLTEVTIQSI